MHVVRFGHRTNIELLPLADLLPGKPEPRNRRSRRPPTGLVQGGSGCLRARA